MSEVEPTLLKELYDENDAKELYKERNFYHDAVQPVKAGEREPYPFGQGEKLDFILDKAKYVATAEGNDSYEYLYRMIESNKKIYSYTCCYDETRKHWWDLDIIMMTGTPAQADSEGKRVFTIEQVFIKAAELDTEGNKGFIEVYYDFSIDTKRPQIEIETTNRGDDTPVFVTKLEDEPKLFPLIEKDFLLDIFVDNYKLYKVPQKDRAWVNDNERMLIPFYWLGNQLVTESEESSATSPRSAMSTNAIKFVWE